MRCQGELLRSCELRENFSGPLVRAGIRAGGGKRCRGRFGVDDLRCVGGGVNVCGKLRGNRDVVSVRVACRFVHFDRLQRGGYALPAGGDFVEAFFQALKRAGSGQKGNAVPGRAAVDSGRAV